MKRIMDWLDQRTGARAWLGLLVPRGPSSWGKAIGVALGMTLLLEVLTGVLLTFYYSPSATDAWASVYFIEHELTLGWLVRGTHHIGNSALLILASLYLVRNFVVGAYQAPRELNWITGVLLIALGLGCAMTGNLLPWDQAGYWQTEIESHVMGSAPLIGEKIRTVALGGSEIGNLTLTRYFALHALVLPLLLLLTWAAHVALERKHSQPTGAEPQEKADASTLLVHLITATVTVAIIATLAGLFRAPLEAPASALSEYDARPEWYFYAVYTLRFLFEGPFEFVGTMVIPGLAGGFLLALPFLDRSPDRTLRARTPWVFLCGLGLLVTAGLTTWTAADIAADADYQERALLQARNAQEAVSYAAVEGAGIDAHGRVVLYEGRRLFRRERCVSCHQYAAESEDPQAPSLDGFLSRAWIRKVIANPNTPDCFGLTRLVDEMPAFEEDLSATELEELTEYLASLSGEPYTPNIDMEKAQRGAALFGEGECAGCHEVTREESVGPAFGGYGSRTWLKALLQNPTHPAYYGEAGDGMPAYTDLTARELNYLTTWLLSLKHDRPAEGGARQ